MSADYLRVSVTDRCNLRCVYCHPLNGCDFVDRAEILRFEEIHRIVRLFVECGIRKVRLTGGEPLIRKNIVALVEQLAEIPGMEQLTLTTNGVLLEPLAQGLKDAGLQRVNISIDSIECENYKQITGFDLLPKVTKAIYAALKVGLAPVKINSVIIRGVNVSQILPLAQLSIYLPVAVRFIEYCPTSKHTKPASDYVSSGEVRRIIEQELGPLSSEASGDNNGPAAYFKAAGSAGTIGFISGRSSTFCQGCNRLRLTSDGKIKPCLYSNRHYDIKELIRSDASDVQVQQLVEKIMNEKPNFTKVTSRSSEFCMQNIGG